MFKVIRCDIRAILKNDIAAKGVLEILLTYSGFHAILLYRLAHFLYMHRFKLIAKLISNFAKMMTGIDIHPAALIGKGIFIDHGVGVVIGETTIIGNNVIIYQGATLGSTGKESGKRHPTIEDNVIISAGAKVLGSFTVHNNAKIGAGAVVLQEVPSFATVVGIPAKVVKIKNEKIKTDNTNEINLLNKIKELENEIQNLKKEINQIKNNNL